MFVCVSMSVWCNQFTHGDGFSMHKQHFIAVSAWLIMKSNYKTVPKEQRIDYWIGIGSATWSVAVIGTFFHFG